MIEKSRSLVLQYNPGQFTFRHVNSTASDAQLVDLARQINAFQEDDLYRVVQTIVRQF